MVRPTKGVRGDLRRQAASSRSGSRPPRGEDRLDALAPAQLNDPYVEEAKRQGYRSRAAFKLAEIDDKYHLLRPGMSVVDLGAAPGGWSQIAAQRVH